MSRAPSLVSCLALDPSSFTCQMSPWKENTTLPPKYCGSRANPSGGGVCAITGAASSTASTIESRFIGILRADGLHYAMGPTDPLQDCAPDSPVIGLSGVSN